MAPRAHSNTEACPSGPHRNWPIGHKQNLFSPSGSYAGPSGPYKSWPTWPQQNLFGPSGSHAGPSGPQYVPYIPNTYHNEIQRGLPMQPEAPHRRRRGAKKNIKKKNRQGGPKSKSKPKSNLILESRITASNKESYKNAIKTKTGAPPEKKGRLEYDIRP